MTSVDKAAIAWSIAIVAVAIGFTAIAQSSTTELTEGPSFGFGGTLGEKTEAGAVKPEDHLLVGDEIVKGTSAVTQAGSDKIVNADPRD